MKYSLKRFLIWLPFNILSLLCIVMAIYALFIKPCMDDRDKKIDKAIKIIIQNGQAMNVDVKTDTRPIVEVKVLNPPETEIEDGELEILAQLVQAEAGNQNIKGKRLVVDVVLNRVDSEDFPDTIEEVIFQYGQFAVIEDGAFDRVSNKVADESYDAVRLECWKRTNNDILYFSRGKSEYASNHFKHQDHWFGW